MRGDERLCNRPTFSKVTSKNIVALFVGHGTNSHFDWLIVWLIGWLTHYRQHEWLSFFDRTATQCASTTWPITSSSYWARRPPQWSAALDFAISSRRYELVPFAWKTSKLSSSASAADSSNANGIRSPASQNSSFLRFVTSTFLSFLLFITSAKEVMFSLLFVCLFVYLLATLPKSF